jgi:hypothetical protein
MPRVRKCDKSLVSASGLVNGWLHSSLAMIVQCPPWSVYCPKPAPLRRRESSLNQGVKWKALINKYIGNIPVNGDASCAAEQTMSDMLSPWILVSSAIIAKVGAAARESQLSGLTSGRS